MFKKGIASSGQTIRKPERKQQENPFHSIAGNDQKIHMENQ